MKTAVVSVRLEPKSKKQLEKLARQWGRSPGEIGGQLLEESLRRAAYSNIEFRTTPAGRQAYIAGTRLALWQLVDLLRQHDGNAEKAARFLRCPKEYVRTAELYAKAYPQEIEAMISDNKGVTFEGLSRLLPKLEKCSV